MFLSGTQGIRNGGAVPTKCTKDTKPEEADEEEGPTEYTEDTEKIGEEKGGR
jgi:hypothetical protein